MDFLQFVGGILALVFAIVFSWGLLENARMVILKNVYDRATRTKAFYYFLGHLTFVTALAVTAYWLLWR